MHLAVRCHGLASYIYLIRRGAGGDEDAPAADLAAADGAILVTAKPAECMTSGPGCGGGLKLETAQTGHQSNLPPAYALTSASLTMRAKALAYAILRS